MSDTMQRGSGTTADPLQAVQEAAQARTQADETYRDSIYLAHLAGASYADIAAALGVSRQAVRQISNRAKTRVTEKTVQPKS